MFANSPPRGFGDNQGAPLGTARWASGSELVPLAYDGERSGKDADLFLGWSEEAGAFVGGRTDQHALVCMGARGGKGTTVIVPNLISWQGSCVVIDPKGENATVTARRRGQGSEYAEGLGQKVYVLDPFGVAEVDDDMRARFNPLDAISLHDDEAADEAARIADAIVVQDSETGNADPHWADQARYLIKGLILHVLTDPAFEGMRTLVSVRKLLVQGDWLSMAELEAENRERRANGGDPVTMPDPFEMLWMAMIDNPAFEGIVTGVGQSFMSMPEKERGSVQSMAKRQTEFIESPRMRTNLEGSDFSLKELKTDPEGVSIYLSLPARYMGTHFRWLRMLVTLTLDEMERVSRQPACGYPVLVVLDEFAGLKRMRRIEDATAQIPGYGVKLMFVVQSLGQLKEAYKDNWETFIACSGVGLFAANADEFTLQYLSNRLGQTEVNRTVASENRTSNTPSVLSMFSQVGTSTPSTGLSEGTSNQLHKSALLNPDEIAFYFSPSTERMLAFVAGMRPAILRKLAYYLPPSFSGMYDPHPDHPDSAMTVEQAALIRAEARADIAVETNEVSTAAAVEHLSGRLTRTAAYLLQFMLIKQAKSSAIIFEIFLVYTMYLLSAPIVGAIAVIIVPLFINNYGHYLGLHALFFAILFFPLFISPIYGRYGLKIHSKRKLFFLSFIHFMVTIPMWTVFLKDFIVPFGAKVYHIIKDAVY